MIGLLGLAFLFLLTWILLTAVVHVSVWMVHVLLVAAIVAAVFWLLDRSSGPRTRV
jgi:hypothetical protein